MDISTLLLIINVIISILHPIKHIPQILHTINTKRVEDLSKTNIICELSLNILSLSSCILVYFYMGKQLFFLPIIIEKGSSTLFICIIYILKIKYTRVYSYEEIIPISNRLNSNSSNRNSSNHGSTDNNPLINI